MIIKKVFYIKEVKQMFTFTKKVLCIHMLSLNQITTTKKIYFFLVTNKFIELLNCVQFTATGSLF